MSTKPNRVPSISLLIVEDCEITSKCYSNVLTMLYPEVTFYTANNGTTGLELFKAHMPDIVVTDYNMPDMDGGQMAVHIRAIKPETKLIVITGDSDRLEEKDLGPNQSPFDHIIVKPIDFQRFIDVIKQCKDEIAQQAS